MSNKWWSDKMAELQAEDDLLAALCKLKDCESASVIAVKLAAEYWHVWQREQEKMLISRDPRLVYRTRADETLWVAEKAAQFSRHRLWRGYPVQLFRDILDTVPSDVAAYTAYRMAEYMCGPGKMWWRS